MEGSNVLLKDEDVKVLSNIGDMGEYLVILRKKMEDAEEAYNEAKRAYQHYATDIMPMAIIQTGLTSIRIASGKTLTVDSKYVCSPNKNEEDRKVLAQWLKANGGDFLVKEKATVDTESIDALRNAAIPYTEVLDINSNSLKAFLKEKIGVSNGVQQIEMHDIPACAHFMELFEVKIT